MIYQFINNVGDYFSTGYFTEDFLQKVQTAAGRSSEEMKQLNQRFAGLREQYFAFKGKIMEGKLTTKYRIEDTHNFNTRLLKALGYDLGEGYDRWLYLDDHSVIPVRHILSRGDQREMLIMEMQPMLATEDSAPDGLFEQRYSSLTPDPGSLTPDPSPSGRGESPTSAPQKYDSRQWSRVWQLPTEGTAAPLPEGEGQGVRLSGVRLRAGLRISPSVINEAITAIFYLPEKEKPRYILMMAGNRVYLIDSEKWHNLSYLEFDIEQLFIETQATLRNRDYFALFYLLCSRETLANEADIPLMERLEDESYKNAYAVTRDLRDGVVHAVEMLANEALYFLSSPSPSKGGDVQMQKSPTEQSDHQQEPQICNQTSPPMEGLGEDFEVSVRNDCVTLVYRLLFLFYAESRPELKILPTNDEVYQQGYSLEMLRDLEQVPLQSEQERNGYFFDDSIKKLFALLASGKEATGDLNRSFAIKKIDSPMFNDHKLNQLQGVRFRNFVWQEIICLLSLSKETKGKARGRISYANLGINQLGSVYESLLAYRGFYAEEDYIEVHKKGDTAATYLVPRSRMDVFTPDEILSDEDGNPKILPKGSFVYRLNGRDRQKSASFYTPEVLTKSTVKYTLKGFSDRISEGEMRADDILNLKILEPAMGAAAFLNEVVNQLAKFYIDAKEKELVARGSTHISPDRRQNEIQKVKAYIATHNVYGVDLNPMAIELGKLSLWLNVIHENMETPFFSNRLALGNAVIGAWLKCYGRAEVVGLKGRNGKLEQNKWWEKAPHKISFLRSNGKPKTKNQKLRADGDIYHFLLPDPGMLAVTGIKELKQVDDNDRRAKAMKALVKEWTAPIDEPQFGRLKRISQKIDLLLYEYFQFQQKLNMATEGRDNIYGQSRAPHVNLDTYEEKEAENDKRYRHDNAYMKLKTVMDYWCSLWFWEYQDAELLPKLDEYWDDIEAILDISDDKLRTYMEEQNTDEYSEANARRKNDQIAESARPTSSLFWDSARIKTVQRLADRYHFFHPMLEFLEVFWLRDGFDIVCGNPPWIKYEFDEISIMSEKFPEVAIRKVSALDVRKARAQFFENRDMDQLYWNEYEDYAGSVAFMNATANYPLLKGQHTNLYKCILENGFSMMSEKGFMGLLHPETVYDDPHGQPLRREIYHRLRYHFQFVNVLKLFSEILHWTVYGVQVYGGKSDKISFISISDLFTPSTIDDSLAHDGHGICGGIKVGERWNTAGHRDRVIHYGENELRLLAKTFENSDDWESAKLVSIHSQSIISVLSKIAKYPSHISDKEIIISPGFNETTAVDNGIIKRNIVYPDIDSYEMVFKGPQFYLCNPWYKNPRENCRTPLDYDTINLEAVGADYVSRTNFTPAQPLSEYTNQIKGFLIGQDDDGNPIYEDWLDYYKLAFRSQLSQTGERTLICAVLPRKTAHIHAVISTAFRSGYDCVDMAVFCSSLPVDFYIKVMAAGGLFPSRMQALPIGVPQQLQVAAYSRILLLNCLTNHYADLWQECWREDYRAEQWSVDDPRLKPFSGLTREWNWHTPLRNYFERRQALVEIDVIAAMALGLSLEDLEMIYTIQFPVLQQNEADTWYDQRGNIVFTCSKGLTGVGCDRKEWESIRGISSPSPSKGGDVDMQKQYDGGAQPYVHTIDPAKSELYGGQQVTYYPPFTRCDRIEDYRRAWAFFEERFKDKQE